MIRPARQDELETVAAIESAAEAAFDGTAMAFVCDLPRTQRSSIALGHLLLVAVDERDTPVGFLDAEAMDGWLHIHEMSVHPAAQRQGHARALIEAARLDALRAGLLVLSLTTDRFIPFNGPLYGRLGFRILAPEDQPAWLRAVLRREVAAGFDPARRVAMSRTA